MKTRGRGICHQQTGMSPTLPLLRTKTDRWWEVGPQNLRANVTNLHQSHRKNSKEKTKDIIPGYNVLGGSRAGHSTAWHHRRLTQKTQGTQLPTLHIPPTCQGHFFLVKFI